MMDGPESWLMIVCLILIAIGLIAQVIPTDKHREDTTAYWKRKIENNGKRQRWGGK